MSAGVSLDSRDWTADDADGHQTAGEFGYGKGQLAAAAAGDNGLAWGKAEYDRNPLAALGHGALDLAGRIPGLGEVADGINAAWYSAEGDWANAGLSAAAMIPFVGWGATGGKPVGQASKPRMRFRRVPLMMPRQR